MAISRWQSWKSWHCHLTSTGQGQHSPTCAGLAHGQTLLRDCRASDLTDRQVSGFIFSWFLENTERTKALSETYPVSRAQIAYQWNSLSFWLTSSKTNLFKFRKQRNTCYSGWAANYRWNTTHPPVRATVVFPVSSLLFSSMKPLILPISFQFCRGWHF